MWEVFGAGGGDGGEGRGVEVCEWGEKNANSDRKREWSTLTDLSVVS